MDKWQFQQLVSALQQVTVSNRKHGTKGRLSAGKGLGKGKSANSLDARSLPLVDDPNASSKWVGNNKQIVWWLGKKFVGHWKPTDWSCSHCGAATCRGEKSACWVCHLPRPAHAAAAPASFTAPLTSTAASPTNNKADAVQHPFKPSPFVNPPPQTAESYGAALKPPPNLAAVAGATVAAAAAAAAGTSSGVCGVEARCNDGVDNVSACASAGGVGGNPCTAVESAGVLDPPTLASIKRLASAPLQEPAIVEQLKRLLDRHAAAVATQVMDRATAKCDAVDLTGKSPNQAVGIRVAFLAQVKREMADLAARRDADAKARAAETARVKVEYEERIRFHQDQLAKVTEARAAHEAQWNTYYAGRVGALGAKFQAAEAAYEKAVLLASEAGTLADAVPNNVAAEVVEKPAVANVAPPSRGQTGQDAEKLAAASAEEEEMEYESVFPLPPVIPFTPPPSLPPPTSDEQRAKLQTAKMVLQHWQVQEVDWPITLKALGLTPSECATLVGGAAWARSFPDGGSPLMDDPLKRSLLGTLGCALTNLEVDTASVMTAAHAAGVASMDGAAKSHSSRKT